MLTYTVAERHEQHVCLLGVLLNESLVSYSVFSALVGLVTVLDCDIGVVDFSIHILVNT